MTGPRGHHAPLDVYLQPAVVGGGLGDIEEVLAVGRRLARRGWRPFLYRKAGRPLPRSVEGPWRWPPMRRIWRLRPTSPHALTVTPWWGVSAVPERESSGVPGVWSPETDEIERAYGMDRVVHLSLEEFARTLTSRQQTRERWREGGVAARVIDQRLRNQATGREIRAFHDAYRKWRAFDRSNVLHLFTGFVPSRPFAREFPEAIQAGPLWPEKSPRTRHRFGRRRWIWYASPSTSDRLAGALAKEMPAPAPGQAPVEVEVRGPRAIDLPRGRGLRWRWVEPTKSGEWSRRFRTADLRLVTGSRTLLEAITAGGPFLYFNGVLNRGSRTRRHRPEKIDALLEAWRRHGVSPSLRHDLADFSRLRRVSGILERAVADRRWAAQFPTRWNSMDYPTGWADGGRLIDGWADDWAHFTQSASEFVAGERAEARRRQSRL
jgi:hypothetical protein